MAKMLEHEAWAHIAECFAPEKAKEDEDGDVYITYGELPRQIWGICFIIAHLENRGLISEEVSTAITAAIAKERQRRREAGLYAGSPDVWKHTQEGMEKRWQFCWRMAALTAPKRELPAAMTEHEAWKWLADAWASPVLLWGDPDADGPRTIYKINVGASWCHCLCHAISEIARGGIITTTIAYQMKRRVSQRRTRMNGEEVQTPYFQRHGSAFLWAHTAEGAADRAAFCREMADATAPKPEEKPKAAVPMTEAQAWAYISDLWATKAGPAPLLGNGDWATWVEGKPRHMEFYSICPIVGILKGDNRITDATYTTMLNKIGEERAVIKAREGKMTLPYLWPLSKEGAQKRVEFCNRMCLAAAIATVVRPVAFPAREAPMPVATETTLTPAPAAKPEEQPMSQPSVKPTAQVSVSVSGGVTHAGGGTTAAGAVQGPKKLALHEAWLFLAAAWRDAQPKNGFSHYVIKIKERQPSCICDSIACMHAELLISDQTEETMLQAVKAERAARNNDRAFLWDFNKEGAEARAMFCMKEALKALPKP